MNDSGQTRIMLLIGCLAMALMGMGESHHEAILDGDHPNFKGQWMIQEEDKSYTATLNDVGNGTYTWQQGSIRMSSCHNRLCQGTWHQPGNNREGGFEILLSETLNQAEGVWWYTRVEGNASIPPRQWGGNFTWEKRSASLPKHE